MGKNEEDMVSQFIDDLNCEKKPRVYRKKEEVDTEMEKTFETIRAVKRIKGRRKKTNK